MKVCIVSALVLGLVVTVASADADPLRNPENAAALDHLKQGNRHLDLEHYDTAIEHYEAGALADPVPVFWLNIGLAHRRAGRYADAARAYRTFLRKVADDPDAADLRAQVEDIVRAMEEAASRPPTEPAPHVQPVTTTEPRPTPGRFTRTRRVAIGVGAAGVIALGTGAGFGLRSRALEQEAVDLCPQTVCVDAERANQKLRDADASARVANIAVGVGVAALVGGVVLWYLGAPADGEAAVSIAPHVSATYAGAGLTMRF